MGFYYSDGVPPEKQSRVGRLVPQWMKNFWAEFQEIFTIIRMVFGIMLPVLGVLIGFVVLLALLVTLLSVCAGGGR